MEELYELIEQKIRDAGYMGEVDGFAIYEEISYQIEEAENGSYMIWIPKAEAL